MWKKAGKIKIFSETSSNVGMLWQKRVAFFLISCTLFLSSCAETAVPQATAVSPAAPTEQFATTIPATNTPVPEPTELPPTQTAVPPTAAPPPSPSPTPEIWQELAKMPTSRSEMSAGVIDGRIYVPGGWDNGYAQTTVLEVYDPANDTWSTAADLPYHVNHHATAVYNNALYVFGPEAASLRYDPTTNTWEELTPMPEERWAGAAAVLDDYIYFLGGSSSNADLLRYDPATDNWTRLAPLLQPREHTQAVALDGKLYALGGRWDRGLNSVERYDPATDTWTRVPSMKHPRSGFGAAVWNGKIIVAGGELLSPLVIIDSLELYDPAKNRWELMPISLPAPLHGLPIAVLNDTLYLLGGSGLAGDVYNRGRVFQLSLN